MQLDLDIPNQVLERARSIKLVIFDVDGVLTDGSLYFTDAGEQLKAFNSRDGLGINLLRKSGFDLGIVTARKSTLVAARARELGIVHVYQGVQDKNSAFNDLLKNTGHMVDETCYIGDDLVDLPLLGRVALSVAVADAHPLVRDAVHWVTPLGGGRGAVRQLCDALLLAQGLLENIVDEYKNS